jgi:hypothetical protein
MVTVKSKTLHEMVQALRLGKCSAICEFHPQHFDAATEDAPFIERIEIARPNGSNEAMGQAKAESGNG